MSNSSEQTLEEEHGPSDQNPNEQSEQQQSEEWEIMARAWLCSFPEPKEVSMDEVEAWIDSNHHSLPEGIKSMPRSDLAQRLISIQNCMRLPSQEKEMSQFDLENPPYRFQRTDQWRPVYSWLESLDQDEVVKSKEISDWLTANPDIQEQLCSRHSRYHLMHYIKKCHIKILKRKEKKMGLQQQNKETSLKVRRTVMMKQPAQLQCSTLSNLPKDGDVYLTKRKEAYLKYEILVELEKMLSPIFLKRQDET
ncbi:LOC18438113 isoform [Fagus crenata]|uniref:Channel forming colicins domain-containing protein n=1 Tax=Fagus sylvatica TaxID=28930 RepID=A0A2N9IET5_FAGSY